MLTPPPPTAVQPPTAHDSPTTSASPQAIHSAPHSASWPISQSVSQQTMAADTHAQQAGRSKQQPTPSASGEREQQQQQAQSVGRPGWRGWVNAALDSDTPQNLLASETTTSGTANGFPPSSREHGPSWQPAPDSSSAPQHQSSYATAQARHQQPTASPASLQANAQSVSWQSQQSLHEPLSSQQPASHAALGHQQHSQQPRQQGTAEVAPKPAGRQAPPRQQQGLGPQGHQQGPVMGLSQYNVKLIREACHVVMTLAERQGLPEMLLPILESMQQVCTWHVNSSPMAH